ncbi:MAG: sialate O-acetylesterase [Planctomycetota bacterium]
MRLAALFTDHAVLQRDVPLTIWGWAEPGQVVAVEFAGQTRTAAPAAPSDGRWQVELSPLPAGGPHRLVARVGGAAASAGAQAVAKDVYLGEVWVCSGQSNMEWPLELTENAAAAVAAADLPLLRLFKVPKRTGMQPEPDVQAVWELSKPETAGSFSAVGYFFGRELHERLNVPVGLIDSSWGGTPAQAWTSEAGLRSEPALDGYIKELEIFQRPPEEIRAYNAAQRAAFLAKLPQDAGNRGFAQGWAGLECNDADWPAMNLPTYWINAGHATNGVFWFRRTVEVPAAWAGQPALLTLGAVDKSDDTYVNGVRVGGMNWAEDVQSWSTPRRYPVPAGVLKAGRNVIAVRALSNYTGGGLTGPASTMALHPPEALATDGGPNGAQQPLAGAWRYKIEQDFGRVTGIAEPPTLLGANTPTVLFNGMIAPLIPAAIRGAIWYQGESNAADAARYRVLFPAMIRDWRRHWKLGDFPFYFVQLANFESQPARLESDDSRWAELREAQSLTRALPHTGMAVTIDIGEPKDIHPRNKRDVGLRLTYNALAQTHGQKVACLGPTFTGFTASDGGRVRVAFKHAAGLRARGGAVRGFAVAGPDRVFHAAEAQIDGETVVLHCAAVPAPAAVRYGWADCPVCTLENSAGLPAEPFRSDGWPVGLKPA